MPFWQKVPFEHAIFPRPLASNVIDAARPAVDQTFKRTARGKQAIERVFDEFGVAPIAAAANQDSQPLISIQSFLPARRLPK